MGVSIFIRLIPQLLTFWQLASCLSHRLAPFSDPSRKHYILGSCSAPFPGVQVDGRIVGGCWNDSWYNTAVDIMIPREVVEEEHPSFKFVTAREAEFSFPS